MDAISVLRDALIDLPRKELQAKAKTIGIAANLKTSEIIELILQHSQKNSKEPDGVLQPHNPSLQLNLGKDLQGLHHLLGTKGQAVVNVAAPSPRPPASRLPPPQLPAQQPTSVASLIKRAAGSTAALSVQPATHRPLEISSELKQTHPSVPSDKVNPGPIPQQQFRIAAPAQPGYSCAEDPKHEAPPPPRSEGGPLSSVGATALSRAAAASAARRAAAAAAAAAPGTSAPRSSIQSPLRNAPAALAPTSVTASLPASSSGAASFHRIIRSLSPAPERMSTPKRGSSAGESSKIPARGPPPPPTTSPLAVRASSLTVASRSSGGGGHPGGGSMASPYRPRPASAAAAPSRTDLVSPARMARPSSAAVGKTSSQPTAGAGMLSPMRGVAMGKDTSRALMSPMRSPLNRPPARRVVDGDSGATKCAPTAAASTSTCLAGSQHFFDELVRRELLMGPTGLGTPTGFKTVNGLSGIKQRLNAVVSSASAYSKQLQGSAKLVQQVLLYGPQGVGKTLVAKALAYEVSSLPTTTAAPPPATATISVRAGGTVHRNSSAAPPAAGLPPQRPAVVASGGGGLSYYVDVARLLAGQQSGSQADKVLQAVFKALDSRCGPSALVLDNLEALQDAQLGDDFGRADAACRLRAAVLAGLGAASSLARSAGQSSTHHPLVVVGVAGSRALSIDDEISGSFKTEKIFVPPPDAETREALLFVDLVSREAALGVGDIEELVSRTEGLSSADVLRVCSQAASQSQPKPRAKWGGQQAELGSSAVAGGGEGGCSVLRMVHFDSALARVKPCMSDTEAAAYAKWKPGASL